jgi:hypothetical protein
VTGEQTGVARQGEHLRVNAFDEGVIITAWQICAANAPLENDVAAQKHFLCCAVKHNVPTRVAGCVADYELVATQVQDLPRVQIDGRFWTGVYAHAKKGCAALGAPEYVVLRV